MSVICLMEAVCSSETSDNMYHITRCNGRSQWPRGLRRRSAAAWLLGLDSNPARGMDVCLLCLYVVLSCVGRGLCDGLITRPGVLPYVSIVCDQENLNGWGKPQQWGKVLRKKIIIFVVRNLRLFITSSASCPFSDQQCSPLWQAEPRISLNNVEPISYPNMAIKVSLRLFCPITAKWPCAVIITKYSGGSSS
jgi:hypothetical protein